MRRRRELPWLALACLLLSSPTVAQVNIVTVTTITCTTPLPAGAKANYVWYADAGLVLTPVGGGVAVNASGPDGTYEGVVVATINGVKTPTPFEVAIGDTPAPPVVETLRSLVTATEAAQAAEYFRDFAGLVSKLESTAQFWEAFTATFPIKGNAKLDAALKIRLDEALTRPKELSASLLAIAAEFGTVPPIPDPPKPPVVDGKRQLILLREAGEMTPELNTLVAKLQAIGPDHDWLVSNGHRVFVYDDEQRANGEPIPLVERLAPLNPLPEAYVLDLQGNVLGNMDVDPTGSDATTSAQLTEFVRLNGG